MFDLETALAEWRKQMPAAGVRRPVPLEELEIHLREEIEQSVKLGLNEQNAFNSSVQKIGTARAVRNEFKKIETIREARHWKLFGIFLLAATFWIPLSVGGLAYLSKDGSLSEMTSSQKASGLAATVTFSLLAWATRLTGKRFPVIAANRVRDAIFVPVLLWLVVFAYVIMPHSDFAMSQRSVVSLWGIAPLGMLIGWVWGFAAARKKS